MWNYSPKVMEYFLTPKNIGEVENPDGVGEVGNASCGDALRFTFKLDENGRIAEAKFKTFGCVSAIASSSALTELVKGMTLEEAEKVTNQDIVKILGMSPLTQRRITGLISELDMMGLINASIKSFGRAGRTKEITLGIQPDVVAKFKQDPLFEPIRNYKVSTQTKLM